MVYAWLKSWDLDIRIVSGRKHVHWRVDRLSPNTQPLCDIVLHDDHNELDAYDVADVLHRRIWQICCIVPPGSIWSVCGWMIQPHTDPTWIVCFSYKARSWWLGHFNYGHSQFLARASSKCLMPLQTTHTRHHKHTLHCCNFFEGFYISEVERSSKWFVVSAAFDMKEKSKIFGYSFNWCSQGMTTPGRPPVNTNWRFILEH